ncbi:hypothetical protein B0J13DRAFT_564762 [Dactylonectria estremocensis]|uniref:Uncharacterized protein n=1 Tax=Dactylonectria estremocensis TaxID=1079267 RepID=A0A9P9DZA9_9HYPO|nr:hypothetical protein B0J13DRAFT_564762 [Dactylonectria estremocensis]
MVVGEENAAVIFYTVYVCISSVLQSVPEESDGITLATWTSSTVFLVSTLSIALPSVG